MSSTMVMAYFDHEQDVLAATAELRRRSFEVADVYSPHAIHGMDEALGLEQSRLPWVCFLCGAFGTVAAFWFQHWANAVDWAINVGGKPWNSLPAETPVAFEVMVLFAAFGSVAACLAVCRLYPSRKSNGAISGATDDQYIIELPTESLASRETNLQDVLYSMNARRIEHRVIS